MQEHTASRAARASIPASCCDPVISSHSSPAPTTTTRRRPTPTTTTTPRAFSLDGGKTFFSVGTHLSMTVLTEGQLTLHYWDSNNLDNLGTITVIVQIYSGPINVSPGGNGP